MKQKTIVSLVLNVFLALSLSAQSDQGINFQMVFKDANGEVLSNQLLSFELNLIADQDIPEILFQELHKVQTDDLGLATIRIGEGSFPMNSLQQVPWAKKNILLQINLLEGNSYQEIIKTQLFSVPYAMHAKTAAQLTATDTTNVSLREDSNEAWQTSGNTKSIAHSHYIGTRDAMNFYIKTFNETRVEISRDGRVTYFGQEKGPEGPQENKASYPMVIERGNHGIYIELNEKRVTNDNNFVTFADEDEIEGRVEGETKTEYFISFKYLFKAGKEAFNIYKTGKEIIDQFSEGSTLFSDGFGGAASIGAYVNAGANVVELASKIFQFGRDLIDKINNLGVRYKSGGADYAEWLPKEHNTLFLYPGQVVGVKGGKVSLNTTEADDFMVVSSNPIVLGNTPPVGKESDYERIAMLGQVLVSVLGSVQSGDYILPSGNNDGLAIAVTPEDMQTGDYQQIIGVAWESVDSQKDLIHLVNVAIGVNTNDLSQKLSTLEYRADNIIAYLNGEAPLMTDETMLHQTIAKADQANTTAPKKLISDEAFDNYIDQMAPQLMEAHQMAKDMFIKEGYDLEQYPFLNNWLNDPVGHFKQLRRDENYASQMGYLDLIILGED